MYTIFNSHGRIIKDRASYSDVLMILRDARERGYKVGYVKTEEV